MKMHKNCCHAPDCTGGAYSTPPDTLAGLEGGAPGEREGGRGGG